MASTGEVERRAERLRPAQLRKLREACPLAFLPLGILEWHGPHNPIGLDGVKAHALCVRTAARTGGVVFPTLYWGSPPATQYLEVEHPNPFYAKTYGLPAGNFEPRAFGFPTRLEQWELFGRVFDLSLRFIARYGFRAVYAISGHYPLASVKHLAGAFEREMKIPVFLGHEGVTATPPDGDHAAQWETSITWALEPDTVDPVLFPKPGRPNPPGVFGKPVSEVTPELARANLERVLAGMEKTAKDLVERAKKMQSAQRKRR